MICANTYNKQSSNQQTSQTRVKLYMYLWCMYSVLLQFAFVNVNLGTFLSDLGPIIFAFEIKGSTKNLKCYFILCKCLNRFK